MTNCAFGAVGVCLVFGIVCFILSFSNSPTTNLQIPFVGLLSICRLWCVCICIHKISVNVRLHIHTHTHTRAVTCDDAGRRTRKLATQIHSRWGEYAALRHPFTTRAPNGFRDDAIQTARDDDIYIGKRVALGACVGMRRRTPQKFVHYLTTGSESNGFWLKVYALDLGLVYIY